MISKINVTLCFWKSINIGSNIVPNSFVKLGWQILMMNSWLECNLVSAVTVGLLLYRPQSLAACALVLFANVNRPLVNFRQHNAHRGSAASSDSCNRSHHPPLPLLLLPSAPFFHQSKLQELNVMSSYPIFLFSGQLSMILPVNRVFFFFFSLPSFLSHPIANSFPL